MGIKSFWSWWSNSKLQQEITKQRDQLTNNSIQNEILVNSNYACDLNQMNGNLIKQTDFRDYYSTYSEVIVDVLYT